MRRAVRGFRGARNSDAGYEVDGNEDREQSDEHVPDPIHSGKSGFHTCLGQVELGLESFDDITGLILSLFPVVAMLSAPAIYAPVPCS